MMGYWNHQISEWLNHYVKKRLETPGVKPGLKETMITFGVSALWHGFYPYYYFMFFQCGCFVELAKDVYRSRILFSFIPENLRDPVANFMTMLILNYLGTSFNLLTFEKGAILNKGTNYIIMIGLVGSLIASKSLGMVKIAQKA